MDGMARTVLRDWQYGKIPYMTQPDENYTSKERDNPVEINHMGSQLLHLIYYIQ